MPDPRVLITGANGLLGQALVTCLSRDSTRDVLATGRDDAPRLSTPAAFDYAPLDITEPDAVRRRVADFAPDVVINCAAMTQVDRCEEERDACWRVNAEAVETLARQCRETDARLVQVSTDFVFDGEDGPYREDDPPGPVNYYGQSKLAGEKAAREAGSGQWAVARTVLVYGMAERMKRSNIALWILGELSKGEPIHVVTDQHRTPTYVVDLADGIERIVCRQKSGIFHISGHEMLSIHDLAHVVAEVFDLDASLIHPTDKTKFSQPAPRPPRTGFVIDKAEAELDYAPRPLREALRHLGHRLGRPVSAS